MSTLGAHPAATMFANDNTGKQVHLPCGLVGILLSPAFRADFLALLKEICIDDRRMQTLELFAIFFATDFAAYRTRHLA